MAVPAQLVGELQDALADPSLSTVHAKASTPLSLGFVFTGQGARCHATGRELIDAYPVFGKALENAENHARSFGALWSVLGKDHLQFLHYLGLRLMPWWRSFLETKSPAGYRSLYPASQCRLFFNWHWCSCWNRGA